MVKVYGPAMSLAASGSLANTMVFSSWKGRSYVRERVIPANPRSGPQTGLRAMMKFLAQQWASLSAAEQASWETRGDQLVASPFNGFVSYNQKRWRNFLSPSVLDPADETGTAPALPVITPTGGVRQISLSIADGAPAPDFAYAIFRSPTTTFTELFSNCIAVVPWNSGGTTVYVDSPLAPATYYYMAFGTLDTGLRGIISSEASAAAT